MEFREGSSIDSIAQQREAFRRSLDSLAETVTDPLAGFFGPRSVTWRVNREAVLFLGGMRALLMQIAHPKVAQAVADHSRVRDDPFGRLRRTFQAVHTIVFGTRDEALQAALAVHAVHCRVRGWLPVAVPEGSDPGYDANDPELLRWVYATLVDSAVVTHDLFLPPLSSDDRERLYTESKVFAALFGIPESSLPADWERFCRWMAETLAGDVITVTPTARQVAARLFRGSPLLMSAAVPNYVLAAGMLPEKLREGFRLRWNLAVRLSFRAGVLGVRGLTRLLPGKLRTMPVARRAARRCERWE